MPIPAQKLLKHVESSNCCNEHLLPSLHTWILGILISSTGKCSFLNIQSNHCILSSRHIGTAQTRMRITVILLLSGWISVLPVHVSQIWQLWSSASVIGETLIPTQINCIGRELQQPNLVLCCIRYQILRFACAAFACSQWPLHPIFSPNFKPHNPSWYLPEATQGRSSTIHCSDL